MGPQSRTLDRLLCERAEQRPEACVQSFAGEVFETRSLAELATRARALGAAIAQLVSPGERVVLALAPGLGFVDALFACFAARVVAVPAPPGRERLRGIIADARPQLVIGELGGHAEIVGVRCIDIGSLANMSADHLPSARGSADDLALLQYTSGSTGDPRGVRLTHANVLANLAAITEAFSLTPASVGVSWLPHHHDMGLIGTILAPVFVGFAMHRMSPDAFLARPARWLEAITEHRATVSGGPDFGYALCVRSAIAAGLDLSSWQVAFVGAEPVRAATLDAFARGFAARGFDRRAFLPCYGLAESTLFVSGTDVEEAPSVTWFDGDALARGRGVAVGEAQAGATALVGCGRPRDEPLVALRDREGREVAADEVGEITIAGASVSAGYFGRADTEMPLRTGDLGLIHAGQLHVVGRIKDLIIVGGRNLHPQDLEAHAGAWGPPIRPGRAAAFGVETALGERPVLVAEVRGAAPEGGWQSLAEALRRAIGAACEVELDALVLVSAGEVPLTSSGKLRRSTCRQLWIEGRLPALAIAHARSSGALELPDLATLDPAVRPRAIADWLAQQIGRAPGEETLSMLGKLGIDSLRLAELGAELERRCGVRVSLAELLGSTLSELGERIATAIAASKSEIAVEVEGDEVSSGELGFWHRSKLSPDDSADVLARAAWVAGPLDEHALASAIDELVRAHAVLRSEFVLQAGTLRRRVAAAGPGVLQIERHADATREQLLDRMQALALAPMALDRAPLLRAWLLRGGDATLFGVAVHHAVIDEASARLLLAGRASVAMRLPIARFARAQSMLLTSQRGRELAERWHARLARSPAHEAAVARSGAARPAIVERLRLDRAAAERLANLARTLGRSRLSVLATLLATTLARADDARLGEHLRLAIPADLRTAGEFTDVVGYLANLLPIVIAPHGELEFAALAETLSAALHEAIADQAFPYAQVLERHVGFEPDAVLTLHTGPLAGWSAPLPDVELELFGVALRSAALDPRHAQFALHLAVVEHEGVLHLIASADATRYDRTALHGLLEAIAVGLEAAASNPSMRVDELPLTRAGPFALHGAPSSEPPLVLAAILASARRAPDAIAVVAGTRGLSYAALLGHARAFAAVLRERGVSPGACVGLCLRRGPELLVALLAVLETGAAYVPLDPQAPPRRRLALAELARCVVVVCEADRAGEFPSSMIVDLERRTPASTRAAIHPESLACVLFTSGSTGAPKGVAITHGAIANLLAWARDVQGDALAGRVFAGTNLGFDLSLFELLGPLCCGGVVMLGADALDVPRASGVGLLNTVPSVASALLDGGRVPADLRTINLAGEALAWGLVDRLRATAPGAAIYNLYGPTETTTYSTAVRLATRDRNQQGGAPPIGLPIHATRCVLLDQHLRARPPGFVSELYLGGAGLARGYLDRPSMTAAAFVPDPDGPPGARVYRTGDRARLGDDGQLHYSGRIDRQLKLGGVRTEPGEIEATLAGHPSVTGVAVRFDAELRLLVAHVSVAATSTRPDADALRRFAAERLPAAMVPALFEIVEALPRTTRGKIDRAALVTPRLERAPARAPRTKLERELCAIWARVLELETVGIDDDFFALGGHSLRATMMIAELMDRHGIELRVRELFERPTIAALAEAVRAAQARRVPITRRADRSRWPLSYEQTRLWLADRLAPEGGAYNMPVILRWRGARPAADVAMAIAKLADRFLLLRSRVELRDGALGQRIGEAPQLSVERGALDQVADREGARLFDLMIEPPLRATLVELGEGAQALVLTLHHIAADAHAVALLVDALALELGLADVADIAAPRREHEQLDFGDFASWQRAHDYAEPAARWASALADLQPLELPTDRPRRAVRRALAGVVELRLPVSISATLDALGADLRSSRFAVVAAALAFVCARWTGQLAIPLATPISQRGLPGVSDTFGLLLETSILRVTIDRGATVRTLIEQVRDTIVAALDRGPVPLDVIASALEPARRSDLAGLLRVLVTAQADRTPTHDGLEVLEHPRATAKTELSLAISERDGSLYARLEFDRDLFERETVDSFARALAVTLEAFALTPDRPLAELGLLDAQQRDAWLQRSRGDVLPDFDQSVAAMILAQARRTPDRIAVAGAGFEISYAALVDRSLRLARWLRTNTLGPEARVAVCLERGPELIPALLGVLMAGLAFVPVAPELPLARKRQLITRSRAQVLISAAQLATELELDIPLAIPGDPAWQGPRLSDPTPVAEEQLAYLIYTSGSTGTPKGVAITQRSFAARMRWAASAYPHTTLQGVLAASSVAFDLSIFELFAPLVAGGTVLLARDALALLDHPQRARVRLIDTVPSVIATLLRIDRLSPSVEFVNLAGEALDLELVARVLADAPNCRVRNLYGPAEDTTFSTLADVTAGTGPASIGAPLPGTIAYLLDGELAPAPDGAVGELLLGGIGLARGYDHEPAATASRFVPDPHGRPGARVFRTGDLARRGPDGALRFRGRRDRQIKLRGVRIELGEIEATLARCPDVLEVAVVPLPDAHAPQRLVAVLRLRIDPTLDLDGLRAVCARELPSTHQPQLLLVDQLSRTSSGKLDLAAVTELAATFELEPDAIVAPASATETLVHALWAELLELAPERLSVEVDVFSLGAHSLLVASLLARLQTALDLRVPVRAAFEHRSVRGLARWIDAALAERDAELLELFEQVEAMSDEEVLRQLAELE